MNTTVIASISVAAPSRRSDRPYCPALALATTSTGSRRPPGPASLSAAPPGCLPTVPAPAARPLGRPRRPGCPGRRRWSAPRPAVPAGPAATTPPRRCRTSPPACRRGSPPLVERRLDGQLAGLHRRGVRGRRPAPGTGTAGLQGRDGQQQGADAGGLSLAPARAIERGHRNGPAVARIAARWSASTRPALRPQSQGRAALVVAKNPGPWA
jgi:hypothetical protein